MILEHVNLTVSDLDRSIAYYSDLLGLHVRWKGDIDGDRRGAHVGDDDQYLALFESTEDGGVDNDYRRTGFNHIGFVVEDLEEMRRRIDDLGGRVHLEGDYEPGHRIYTFDPDGHEVELVADTRRTESVARYVSDMPISRGFNHVATLTTDMDRTVSFYEQVFGATVTFTMAKTDDHPYMKIVDLGGGAALNIFETAVDEIVGERRRQGARGAIDHFAVAVDDHATLETVRERMVASGAQEVGEIQRLGDIWSLFFRDPDGMELEVACPFG